MIKKDTIVSTTDGRLTLLQWLKKVEDALKNASATAVKGVPQADGKVVFEIDFADGTSIKSDPFQLPEKLPDGYAVDASGNVTLNGGLHVDNAGNVEMGKNAIVNGTLTLNTPENLIFKAGSINPIPEGYAVDGAGNVTIAGAITANNNGDVEVGKNLNVDGKAYFCGKDALIYHGSISTTMQGATAHVTLTALMMNGPEIIVEGEQQGANGPGMLILASMGNDFMVFLGTPLKVDANGTTSPATLEDVYNDNWDPYTSIASCRQPVMFGDNYTALIEHIFTNSIVATGDSNPSIDNSFIINGTGTTLGDVVAKASQAKYQHTVTLHGDGYEFCFTAMSPKNMLVSSYIDLRTVFGGRRIALTGFSAALSARPVYIDLNGKTAETDLIRVYNEAGGGFSDKTLSSIGAIIYEDDVCEPN